MRYFKFIGFALLIAALLAFVVFILYAATRSREPRPTRHYSNAEERGRAVGRVGTDFGKGVIEGAKERLK